MQTHAMGKEIPRDSHYCSSNGRQQTDWLKKRIKTLWPHDNTQLACILPKNSIHLACLETVVLEGVYVDHHRLIRDHSWNSITWSKHPEFQVDQTDDLIRKELNSLRYHALVLQVLTWIPILKNTVHRPAFTPERYHDGFSSCLMTLDYLFTCI